MHIGAIPHGSNRGAAHLPPLLARSARSICGGAGFRSLLDGEFLPHLPPGRALVFPIANGSSARSPTVVLGHAGAAGSTRSRCLLRAPLASEPGACFSKAGARISAVVRKPADPQVPPRALGVRKWAPIRQQGGASANWNRGDHHVMTGADSNDEGKELDGTWNDPSAISGSVPSRIEARDAVLVSLRGEVRCQRRVRPFWSSAPALPASC